MVDTTGIKEPTLLLDRLVRITIGGDLEVETTGGGAPTPPAPPPGPPANAELREDFSFELREDGGYELRDALPPGPPDPYWADVILLLHGIGGQGSFTITDSSDNAIVMSNSGTQVFIDDTSGVFTGGALSFNGGAWLASLNPVFDFNFQDFTMETFVKVKSGTITEPEGVSIFCCRNATDQTGNMVLNVHSDGTIQFYSSDEFGNHPVTFTTGADFPLDSWQFLSLTQKFTDVPTATGHLYIHVNGVLIYTYTGRLSTLYPQSYNIGAYGINGSRQVTGLMQEHRVTLAARYGAADYAVPTARFPEY